MGFRALGDLDSISSFHPRKPCDSCSWYFMILHDTSWYFMIYSWYFMIMESMKAQNAIQVPPPLRSPPASSPPLAPSPVHLGACHRTTQEYHATTWKIWKWERQASKIYQFANSQISQIGRGNWAAQQPATRFQGSRIPFRFHSCLSTASAQPFSSEPKARYAKFEYSNRVGL